MEVSEEGAKAGANLAGRGARQKQQAQKERGKQGSEDQSKEGRRNWWEELAPACRGTLSLIHVAGHS